MVRFLPPLRVHVTRVYHLPRACLARCFCSAPKHVRSDVIDLGVDDIPKNTRASSVVNPVTDPKPQKYSTPLDDGDRAFALAYWQLDEEKIRDGEMDEPEQPLIDLNSLDAVPSQAPPLSKPLASPSFTTTKHTLPPSPSTAGAKSKPFLDPDKAYKDRMKAMLQEERNQMHTQLAYMEADSHERKEMRQARKQIRQAKLDSGERATGEEKRNQRTDEEEEDEDDEDSEEDEKYKEELRNIEDAMAGRAELKNDWYAPLAVTARPNSELCTSMDQTAGFFNQIVQGFQSTLMEGEDVDNLRVIVEYLDNFDQGIQTIEYSLHRQDEEHKNYFLATLAGKAEASSEVRTLLTRCIDNWGTPEFNFSAQAKILRELSKFVPPEPDENDER